MRTLLACLLASLAAAPAMAAQTLFFTCDLNGMPAQMAMQVEAIASNGITWSPGPNAHITGVIPTGDYTIYTAGEVASPAARYVFQGQNQFADFTGPGYERFRVQWVMDGQNNGLWMIVNPFGPGPTQHFCALQGVR